MPVTYLPPEIIELIIQNVTDLKDLLNLNKVSKVCYLNTRKRIWKNFSWGSEGGERKLYRLPEDLRSLVKEVSVWGDEYAQFPVIWTNEVYKLLRRLPSVDTLSIESTAVFEGSRRELYEDDSESEDEQYYSDDDDDHLNEDPASLQITHLEYFAGEINIDSSLLQDILIKLPNINDLTIHLENPEMTRNINLAGSRLNGSTYRVIPLSKCPELSSLSISTSQDPGLFNPNNPLIPYTSLRKLKRLVLEIIDLPETSLLEIVKLASDTLEVVSIAPWYDEGTYKDSNRWKYTDWKPILPVLKVLKQLNIRIEDPPSEIMDILPLSLTTLNLPMSYSHLVQLRNRDQPSPQLTVIKLNHITTSDFVTLLPRSAVEIGILRLESCIEDVAEEFEKIESRGEKLMSFREVDIYRVTRPEEKHTKEEQEKLIDRFRIMEIKLKVGRWDVYP